MTREIKFRAWDIHLKRMMVVKAINFFDNYCEFDHKNIISSSIKDCILMQFTGRLDCEGKEIYEGDILQIDSNYNGIFITSVEFKEGWWSCTRAEMLCDYDSASIKIIGSIYENPELLENEL